jgi:outer membrane protein OmpA-like peptidoglycan-associated protein
MRIFSPDSPRVPVATVLSTALFLALGCQTNTGTTFDNRTTQGAVLGTLAGAAAGAAIDDESRGRGAAIGAVTGALAGGLIGNYLEGQAREIDAIPDANVQQQDQQLLVSFPGDALFSTNSAVLAPGAYQRLRSLSDTLRRYPQSNVVVKGHTDSAGEEAYNLRLSEDRAESVRKYLIAEGVSSYRITAMGFGEAFPVASNATPEGRQQNRRVEIEIRPNEQVLREQAAGPR